MNNYNNNNIYNNNNNNYNYNSNKNYSRFTEFKKHADENNYFSTSMKNIRSQESFVPENNYSMKNKDIHQDSNDSFIMEKSYLD